MKLVIVVSPDKISLKSFIEFIRKRMNNPAIGMINLLMSEDNIKLYVSDFYSGIKDLQGLISFYCRGKRSPDFIKDRGLLSSITEKELTVIWFDLYSLIPVIVLNTAPEIAGILSDWNAYVKKMSW